MFFGILIGIVLGLFLAAAYPAPSLFVREKFWAAWLALRNAMNKDKPPTP